MVVVQGIILVGVGVAMGMRPSWPGVALAIVLAALLTAGIAAAAVALGLASKSDSTVAAVVNGFQPPIMLLAGILIPMRFAPGWLETLSRFNPMTYTVDAARALFAGDLGSSDVVVGAAGTAVLAAVLIAIGTARLQRDNT